MMQHEGYFIVGFADLPASWFGFLLRNSYIVPSWVFDFAFVCLGLINLAILGHSDSNKQRLCLLLHGFQDRLNLTYLHRGITISI